MYLPTHTHTLQTHTHCAHTLHTHCTHTLHTLIPISLKELHPRAPLHHRMGNICCPKAVARCLALWNHNVICTCEGLHFYHTVFRKTHTHTTHTPHTHIYTHSGLEVLSSLRPISHHYQPSNDLIKGATRRKTTIVTILHSLSLSLSLSTLYSIFSILCVCWSNQVLLKTTVKINSKSKHLTKHLRNINVPAGTLRMVLFPYLQFCFL